MIPYGLSGAHCSSTLIATATTQASDTDTASNGARQAGTRSHASTVKQRRQCSIPASVLVPLMLALLIVCTRAQALLIGDHVYEAKHYGGDVLAELLFDRSAPPSMSPMKLKARSDGDSTDLPASIVPSTTRSHTGRLSSTASATIQTASATGAVQLPMPFDANVGANFTASSCTDFFQSFLSNPSFEACHPLSLLLQTLDASCSANFSSCSALMSDLAQEIKKEENCGADDAMGNPVVAQAYTGFLAYDPLYRAGCLRSQDSGGYCYADFVTNATAPTGGYIYYLPLGVSLPAGTRPPCNTCLQDTMAIFQSAATNSSSLLSKTYGPAAQMMDIGCGPSFVAATLSSAAVPSTMLSGTTTLVTVALAIAFMGRML